MKIKFKLKNQRVFRQYVEVAWNNEGEKIKEPLKKRTGNTGGENENVSLRSQVKNVKFPIFEQKWET